MWWFFGYGKKVPSKHINDKLFKFPSLKNLSLLLYFFNNYLTHFMPLVSFDTPWKQERSVAWNGLKCNHLRHLALKPFENLLPILGLNTKNYRVNLRFQSSVGKYRPEKNFISGHFSRIDYYLIYSYMIADDFKENCEVLVNFFKR